ncbi:tyrosine-type recombinase/integrase [Aeoliella mucimassa]|uniref:Site-specific tyrosine recombinase XerC n=1 Tax=Aeoliella mucimassa TaxID=2527972 RepID=A0A518AN75_9BACT|nr:site-specific integrase [Aeoliella mucimassa]QDU56151.1 site-specific tyrosine recombinase XerC [Aeoliella mucimassa]
MAKLGRDSRGSRYIQFENRDGQIKTIRLGKVSKRDSEGVRYHVSELVQCNLLGGVPSPKTTRWLSDLSDQLREKLAKVGLCEERTRGTLGEFIAEYLAIRSDVKDSTRALWRSTHNSLIEYFGANRTLRSITKGDAKAWRLHVAKGSPERKVGNRTIPAKTLAENTVRKRTAVAKSLFNAAIDHELIEINPFAPLPATIVENRKRDYFVTPEQAAKVLEACPDQDWRTIFALCRWGGLRCPSEVLALRWSDVLWDKERFVVESPKTGHRIVPLFPELRQVLDEAYFGDDKPVEFVVAKQRDPKSNFRTTMTKIVKRAGLVPWPKLFHALRASRATELADKYPGHVAAAWLGHSQQIANKHYRQVTDDHFEQAVQVEKRAAPCAAQSVDKQLQDVMAKIADSGNTEVSQLLQLVNTCQVGDEGLEPPTSTV